MIIVTGGAGFIGSNLVRGLNRHARSDIVVVDDLTNGRKFANLVDCDVADYWDKLELLERLANGTVGRPEVVFHQGACAVTTEWDGRYMMENNFRYSVRLLEFCLAEGVPLIYASSAAVYGSSRRFTENDETTERPLNVYGYSKLLFDRYVRRLLPTARSQVVGLRYFNVYGQGEQHKGSMARVAFHLNRQLLQTGEVRLFAGSHGYADGEQRRDFVYVDDVVAVNLWFGEHRDVSGVFNVGTGVSAPFNDVAAAILAWHKRGTKAYIPFPEDLRASYQSFTEADLSDLRRVGCDHRFVDVRTGVTAYLDTIGRVP